MDNLLTKKPVLEVARETGLPSSTLREYALKLSAELHDGHRFPTPRIFSMDALELNGIKYMVFVDGLTGKPVGIIDSEAATHVRGWLRTHLSPKDVEIFVTDLHVTNLSIAKRPLGHALHVADKFHLVRDFQVALSKVLNKRLDDLRNDGKYDAANDLWDAKPAIMTINDDRRLSRERKNKPQLPLPLHRLTHLLEKHSEVDRAFWCRYDLFSFYSSVTWHDAKPHLDRFYDRVEPLRTIKLVDEFVLRVQRHMKSVQNYFASVHVTNKGKLRGATTNAAEQRNATIRKIWRSGNGIRSLELLRLRTLYQPWRLHYEIVRCSHSDCTKWLGPLYGPWPRDDFPPAGMTGPRCPDHAI